ncbi:MAG: NUDIX hydrolase [Clostridiales bacterium]|nr:NUDIX hydrolase [Clostridiales bacterium]
MIFEKLLSEIEAYAPQSEQETVDQRLMADYCRRHGPATLGRGLLAHLTGSGFIVNADGRRALLVHHNQRGAWGWTGGHADGDADLLAVAQREAREETGLLHVHALSPHIGSLDVLPVFGHFKRGSWVPAHIHLSVSYLLWADENQPLTVKPDENSGVSWFPADYFTAENFSPTDTALYSKLMARAVALL